MMKKHLIPSILVVSLIATSCVHSPLGMETGDAPNASAPAAAPIASPQDRQEHTELDSKEQAAVDEALRKAAEKGDIEAVNSALDQGADIEAQDQWGQTALHVAAFQGRLEVAQLLLERGANIEAKDNSGNTSSHEAAWFGHRDVVQFLLERGAKIETQDNSGRTALYWAAYGVHLEVAQLLLERGADIDAKNDQGQTALELAKEEGDQGVVDVLREIREQLKKGTLEALEELQLAPRNLNELIVNMGYGEGIE